MLDAFPGSGFTRYPVEQLSSVEQVGAALDQGAGPRLPYCCILSDTAAADAAALAAAGIAVLVFGPAHGVYPGALGLFAPMETDRTVLGTALGATAAARPVLSEAG